ncbi:hypothetical protein F925_01765 [Acinetobacter lwoffii NCTC 5866 = CIP 64.10 = NIPH 512]|nr:hypothetical protein F925_01765 [Acinetobacter lwoffii NCTC 5866 = CIP 64.10 = NIPH 512]
MIKFLEIFKNNKEVIILIPTLLGGIYQLLNILILVGLPYIRYFSVSQVIPDGLLMLVAIFWIYVVYRIIRVFCRDFIKKIPSSAGERKKYSFLIDITYIFLTGGLGCFFLYAAYTDNQIDSFNGILIRYLMYAWSFIFIFTSLFHLFNVTKIGCCIKNKFVSINQDNKNFILSLLSIGLLGILVHLVPHEIKIINESFIKVSNFHNYSLYSLNVQSHFKLNHSPELLYISKDYAFFKIKEKNETILVVDAKSMTEINQGK